MNVYGPSSVADMIQCIQDLQETLNDFDGDSTAAGDFAHLGTLAGPRGCGPPNARGLVLKEFSDRNNLLPPTPDSLQDLPTSIIRVKVSPPLTTSSLVGLPGYLASANCRPDHPLNVSDHLSLSITLQVTSASVVHPAASPSVNWEKVISTGAVSNFERVRLLNNTCSQLNSEIQFVHESIYHLPPPKCTTRRRNFYNNDHLKQLCKESKVTWKLWRGAGRPQSGSLLENNISAKKRVHQRINQIKARKDRLESG